MGSGDSSVVVEHWTREQKVLGLSLSRSRGNISPSRVNILCWLLFLCPFQPHVTAAAHKRSQSLCQKCKWQVTAKYACTLPMWLWTKWHHKLVHGCMVYTEHALRHNSFTWHQACQQLNSTVTTSVDIWNVLHKSKPLTQSHMTRAQWVSSEAENSAIVAILRWGAWQVVIWIQ